MDRDLLLPDFALRSTLDLQRRSIERITRSRGFPGSANLDINAGAIATLTRVGLASPTTFTTVEDLLLDPGRWLLIGSVRQRTVSNPGAPAFDFTLGAFTPAASTVIRMPSFADEGDGGTQFSLTVSLVVTETDGFTALLRAGLNANDTSVSTIVFDASFCAIPG